MALIKFLEPAFQPLINSSHFHKTDFVPFLHLRIVRSPMYSSQVYRVVAQVYAIPAGVPRRLQPDDNGAKLIPPSPPDGVGLPRVADAIQHRIVPDVLRKVQRV
jgi:hypothetical protein